MGDAPTDHAGLEILDARACEELLASAPVGRVGFTEAGQQFILPVNYVWRDRSIVFRTAAGHKLAAAVDFGEVAFEVDRWDEESRGGWSVLVRGALQVVEHEAELLDLEHSDLEPWAARVDKPFWVRIVPEEMTGRRLPA